MMPIFLVRDTSVTTSLPVGAARKAPVARNPRLKTQVFTTEYNPLGLFPNCIYVD